ncbi:hypothetical protein [Actinomadura parmotrematis]|uniref:CbbX AAA lid domain-containing protein n=1 Tax=Actinomadura parmotrematis TaxID=2864039 RepID=A0ABS7FXQ7_9ACTN|nr:hypothetical protein [Actinomadura parmotrematis]MBW8485227.1 hypothetical protein [Actinomadura parmotrematis]
MVWGPGYGSVPPPSPQAGGDPFDAAERDTRAMVAAGWWSSAPPQQRQHAIAGRLLMVPDGTWWVFGAWARWYRLHPSDGQWYLCPPPRAVADRMAARPGQAGQVPVLPPHVVPAGPDFSYDPPEPLPFVRYGFAPDVTTRVRSTVESAAALPAADYPHTWKEFRPETPATVVACWGVMLWSAGAPVFDSRMDGQLLDLWQPYRAVPLPQVDGPRWLTPPTLEALVGLYAERLRAGRVDAAVVVLRTMWAVASALREDVRFQMRADALLAILGTTLGNPTADYAALPYGDQAIAQQWLPRCPPHLVPSLRNESSPGDAFRHAFYTLAEVLAGFDEQGYIEPRLQAAALLAADLAVLRGDMAAGIVPWLDPEVRYTVQAVLAQSGHPLRRMWPADMRLPEPLGSLPAESAETLLATAFELDLAWCRLAGMPARPRGFPVPTAVIAQLVGRARASNVARAATVTGMPTPVPQPERRPPAHGLHQPGVAPNAPARPAPAPAQPDRPYVQAPAQEENAAASGTPPQGFPPPAAPDADRAGVYSLPEDAADDAPFSPPYTALGFQPADRRPPEQQPAYEQPAAQERPERPAPGTRFDPRPDLEGTRFDERPLAPQPRQAPPSPPGTVFDAQPARQDPPVPPETRDMPAQPAPAPPGRPAPPPPPGTRIMSETMIGNFDFLDDAPAPERPVHEIPPPADRREREVLERFGVGFVSGPLSAGELLDEVRAQVEAWNAVGGDGVEETRMDGAPGVRSGVPSLLLVGAPHTGQRRLARLIALTLADAGLGDGAIRLHDAEDVRERPAELLPALLARPGPALLFERLDVAIIGAPDPAEAAAAVRRARKDPTATTPLIATCDPGTYRRLLREHPRLVEAFRVYRLPDLTGVDNRLTLLHVLAGERRVTLGGAVLEAARADLERMRGPGDQVNARLVETYLDQACQKHLERAGSAHDRLVLTTADLEGVAEGIEPALRPAGDISGYLARLDALTGLEAVKDAVHELAAEAGEAAERRRHGVAAGAPLHLVFTGPGGTGKTTVAGLLGGVYAALGLLASGHVVACRPVHLAGRDRGDTAARVRGMVDQAVGGVLLVQESYLLDRTPAVIEELVRALDERGERFMAVFSGPGPEMDAFLANRPEVRDRTGRALEFTGMSDRDLVRLFQRHAERDLYMLDEELRVELLARFEQLRGDPSFAYARTARMLFEQTVARQAARLAGADVDAAAVARLSVRDLPETGLERMLGEFHQSG